MTSRRREARLGTRYVVSLLGREHEVVVGEEGEVVIDGHRRQASLAATSPPDGHSLILDGASFHVLARPGSRGQWDIDINGRTVRAEVLDERQARVRQLSAAATGAAGTPALKAPMPGLVVQVAVQEGGVVEQGVTVLIVEAMKMENELRAAGTATVKRILVEPGEAVEKGQVLVEYAEVETS